jgi:hypothetical protein
MASGSGSPGRGTKSSIRRLFPENSSDLIPRVDFRRHGPQSH